MSKLDYLTVYCISLFSCSFFVTPQALAQNVGLRECSESLRLSTFNPVSNILQASLSLSQRGYLLTITEENNVQTFGLTNQLTYYYDSSSLFQIEGITPPKIASDGSFLLVLPITPQSGCSYTGRLAFEDGVREQLFPATDPTASCRNAITLAEIRLITKNVQIFETEKQPHNYQSYPMGRSLNLSFSLIGPGTESILASPVFLTTISTDITLGCGDIGLIRFGKYQSEDIKSFGFMNDSTIRPFLCLAHAERGDVSVLPWGYELCI